MSDDLRGSDDDRVPPRIRDSQIGDSRPIAWSDLGPGPEMMLTCPEPIVALHVVGDSLYVFTKDGIYRVPSQIPPAHPRVIEWRWRVKRWVLRRLDRLAAWIRWRW